MQGSPVDPGIFLRSFLAVAGNYVALFFGLLMAMLLIAWAGFPEIYRLWTIPPAEQRQFLDVWENNPEFLFPPGMCWGLIGAAVLLSFAAGVLVAWLAPFSRAGHGVFLAVICIVTFLQIAITQPALPKWLATGLMIVSPIGIVLGSRWGERRWSNLEPTVEDETGVRSRYN